MKRFFLLVLLLASCKTTSSQLSSNRSQDPVADFLDEMKQKYNAGYAIQEDPSGEDDCRAKYVPADQTVPYRGTVVFFHGFTACPQQSWELSQELKAKGFATLSVLLPGQGRAPAPVAYIDRVGGDRSFLSPIAEQDLRRVGGKSYPEYYAEFLPKVQNGDWKRYIEFVEDVNRFVKTLPGEKVVSGLSVGGELATFAYVSSPGLYSRALILAPYYGMPGPDLFEKFTSQQVDAENVYKIQKRIVTMGSRTFDQVAQLEISWGPDCYRWTRDRDGKTGRRGICDFRFENLAAINSVGDYTLTLLKDKKDLTKIPNVQYVAVDWDVGANTVLTRKAIAIQKQRFGDDKVSACFYPNSVPHSFFSRKDLVLHKETPWLDGFYRQAVRFIVEGEAFAHGANPSREFVMDPALFKDKATAHASCSM